MCLATFLRLKRVENAVFGVADLERVPRNRALFCHRQCSSAFEECAEFVTLARLGLEQGEESEFYRHAVLTISLGGWSFATPASLLRTDVRVTVHCSLMFVFSGN